METSVAALPEIPVHDAKDAAQLFAAERARGEALLSTAHALYGRAFVRFADARSRAWLARAETPYAPEIAHVAHTLGAPGAYFLNLSYEWGCTCAVGPDPNGRGWRLVRTLDWPLDGLGRALVALGRETPHGPFIDLTWPGFAGTVQGFAPGRFAAALNQAPMLRRGLPPALDWALNRVRVGRSRALPPTHLLRRALETAPDFAAARRMLTETPLCLPAIFSLAGTEDGCVIERTEDDAHIHPGPARATNHWQSPRFRGTARRSESEARLAAIDSLAPAAGADFAWLVPPILNPTTRLALWANPAQGRLEAQGFEADGPATKRLSLS